ncbi:MAG: hemolysin family protein [Endomicrobium sp.]|jgi:CBS domain containing-hemolysin-like protein|nr:hemolysin family protein [Endomicrobium sp.]
MIIIIIKVILFVLLLCVLSFFSGAETAITSLSSLPLQKIKEKNIKHISKISFLEMHMQELMTAMIIGMNLSLVGMSVIFSSLKNDILIYYKINSNILNIVLPIISIIFALVFGNIVPKTIARYNSEKIGLTTLPFVIRFAMIFKIVIVSLLKVSNKIMKLFGKSEESQYIKASEIDFLLSNKNTCPLPADSRKLIGNIMDFTGCRISQIMIHISGVFAVDINLPKEKIIKDIIRARYSRVPVYKESINNIIGVIHTKDLAIVWRTSSSLILEDLIHPAYYVPYNSKISKMLKEFRKGRQHIAIVVNEFGLTIGIVSIEDLLEEIVGEVMDEYDLKEKTITPIGKDVYVVQAYETILNVNAALNIDIPQGSYTIINGWILELFGKIPSNGERINWQDYLIEIQDADFKKVNRIVLKKCIIQ